MGLISFSNQYKDFLQSKMTEGTPKFFKAIERAQQIIAEDTGKSIALPQLKQSMSKVSRCFKDFPEIRKSIQDISKKVLLESSSEEAVEPAPKRRKRKSREGLPTKKAQEKRPEGGIPKEREELVKETALGEIRVLNKAALEPKLQHIERLIPKEEPAAKVELKADIHPGQSEESIRSYIIPDPCLAELSELEQEKILQKCVDSYRQALDAFEHAVAVVAWKSPEANQFANDFCFRMMAIANAYYEVQCEQSNQPKRDLMRLMNLTQFFASGMYDTGSVGYNAISIEKAIKEGNLREKLSLVYAAVFGMVLRNVVNDKEMMRLVNQKLAVLPQKDQFQLNEAYFEKNVDVSKTEYRKSPVITEHRMTEKGRVRLRPVFGTPPPVGSEGPTIAEIIEPSIREVRAGLGEPIAEKELQAMGREFAARRVSWLGGALIYGVEPKSSFAARAVALGGLPTITGPSGTAEAFFLVARAIGMGEKINEGVLSLAAWLIPARDHSLHEIRIVLPGFGIPYSGIPKDFEGLYNESFSKKVQAKMPQEKLPPYYLSGEYQMKMAKSLERA